MSLQKRLLNTPLENRPDTTIVVDGLEVAAVAGELLVEAVNRAFPDRHLPQVCYLPQMGPIQSCDTCMVEVDGKLMRACATQVTAKMTVCPCNALMEKSMLGYAGLFTGLPQNVLPGETRPASRTRIRLASLQLHRVEWFVLLLAAA